MILNSVKKSPGSLANNLKQRVFTRMSDSESIKKMLRSVLQSSKTGVSINTLQLEYRSLCGESIPLKKLGYSKLEEYLRSIPSVVRLEYQMGELKCFATVCQETAHIAELVARQKSSKKSGHSQVINCKMRFKPSNPYMLNVRPRSSLRQPSAAGTSNWPANRSRSHGGYRGFSASGDYRQLDQRLSSITPVEHRQPASQSVVKQGAKPDRKKESLENSQRPREKPPEQALRPNQSQSSLCDVALVQGRITQLLEKYCSGLWMSKISDVYSEMFGQKLHPQVLIDLEKWTHICMAILYNSSRTDIEATGSQESQQCRSHPLPSGVEVVGPVTPPCLVLPSEQYPSVLITDAKSSNAVTVRYVGENYSNAQEAMEDAMRSFYTQGSPYQHLSNPVIGQLVAVRAEDGAELARAQVMEVMAPDKVKLYYVDYGFSVETSGSILLELHQDFLCLPFQATNVRLAGLETFSSHQLVLSALDRLAVGRILLMETLEPCQETEMPVAVLYDTSQDDDINVNSTCLKALQDKTMNNPLTVNVTYQDVCVTNVCADGIIHCQLPSRGTARLSKLLEKTEAFFISQMTSESLVSRPFCGKFCLARYKGKWSRVEIANMYSNRVMEILYIDLGVPATVEVTDLREIPPLLLKDFTIIPPQAIKCRLADLKFPEGDWSPEAVLWVKEAVLGSQDCKMKIMKLDQHKGDWLVYMYLFIGAASQELDKSINYQLAQSELWQKLKTQNNTTIKSSDSSVDTGLSALVEKLTLSSLVPQPTMKPCHRAEDSPLPDTTTETGTQPLQMPPSLELPQPGQNIDVFVPVACHPGYFVLQPWQDLHKLVVLMGEMILYYNQTWKTSTTTHIQKGDVYAARIDKNWQRVQVKGILANGLVSVYELDHGKHELVRSNYIRPLIEEFRQLPFQAITAQLAGVTQHQWSEEASMLFRNHVEKRALVAHVESVQDVSDVKGELWDRRLTVYLVDTTLEDRDLWIHSILANIGSDLSSAA
ncbi:tudor domain-containing protein 7A isoform X4 [Trachinotus anak]|uniref:tudor domain-containing protein 7A isoform X4 n=1 Tax=Trachinotus anak TaxID=443729 RepID=UPI0039F1A3AB